MRESEVSRQGVRLARAHPSVAFIGRVNRGGVLDNLRGYDVEGASDYIGMMTDGRLLAIEFKRPGWKPGGKRENERFAAQMAFLDAVNRAGGVGFVAYTPGDVLKSLEKRK